MILIVFVALMLFGGEKLPEIARGLGKGIRDFKDASEGIKREINEHINSLDEKRAETALNNQAEAAQNQLYAGTDPLIENPVENTMPVNENHFTGNENTAPDNHEEHHAEPVAEHHGIVSATDAGTMTNEPIKNS
ncbi:MAG TPA: twin-arginine translocase TatA/TatE family subunit [Mucilaginibacter sp.]